MVPDESMRFADRAEAGRALAGEVATYLNEHGITERPLVLGMSRGGVPVAAEVARAIGRRPGRDRRRRRSHSPWQPEYSVGAIAENGPLVINHDALTRANLSAARPVPVVSTEQRAELAALGDMYRDGRAPIDGHRPR